MKNDKTTPYYAHYNPVTNGYQSVNAHCFETADIAVKKNPVPFFENIIWLICIYHDAGKGSIVWQEYFQSKLRDPEHFYGPKEDHTTAGGVLLEEMIFPSLLLELLQMSIYSHHGLQDAISLEDDTSLYVRRKEKAKKLPIQECKEQLYTDHDEIKLRKRIEAAKLEAVALKNRIQDTMKSWERSDLYGNRDFYLGMYVRLLMSLLIDADRRDTEDFMSSTKTVLNAEKDSRQAIWEQCQRNLEKKIADFTDKSGINVYRCEISEMCSKIAKERFWLYRLTVPTGAGKTLSSLRFAVAHAKEFCKKRIIYVAPYNSIVEQNADEIKVALGMPGIVLEHHCNIILETDEERENYDRLTEDWSSPVVVTTAVQFLNTLFAGTTGNVRRMHSLCDSVIILDEVQALPVHILGLFNLAANFLTEFVNTTMVLCTATQPLLDELPYNRLRPPKQMVGGTEEYREKLRRTEIVECITQTPKGMSIDEAAGFILEQAQKYKKILFVANTKACARNIFIKLREMCDNDTDIFHLSTNMCPEHRRNTLKEIKCQLKTDDMQICVSTNLIEAGVDISFRCVIRSLAGLDSVIQSAGRCNRNGQDGIGYVYLVQMNQEAERISMLRDLQVAQMALQAVLDQFRKAPESLDMRLDSEKAIKMYYEYYFRQYLVQFGNQMDFPVSVKNVSTTIVDLLSNNPKFADGQKWMLKQAFKTAGEEFEAILEDGKVSIVVCYNETVNIKLKELENPYISLNRKKKTLRELQPYTISISQTERNKIGVGIYTAWDKRILILEPRFYDTCIGLITDPGPMPDLQM